MKEELELLAKGLELGSPALAILTGKPALAQAGQLVAELVRAVAGGADHAAQVQAIKDAMTLASDLEMRREMGS